MVIHTNEVVFVLYGEKFIPPLLQHLLEMLCIFIVSFCSLACISPHVTQLLTRSLISLVMFGQYTVTLAFQRQDSMSL